MLFSEVHKEAFKMFVSSSLCKYMRAQAQWISRTVMVKDNNVDEAMRLLNGIMSREGMLKRWRGTRYYEKPTEVEH